MMALSLSQSLALASLYWAVATPITSTSLIVVRVGNTTHDATAVSTGTALPVYVDEIVASSPGSTMQSFALPTSLCTLSIGSSTTHWFDTEVRLSLGNVWGGLHGMPAFISDSFFFQKCVLVFSGVPNDLRQRSARLMAVLPSSGGHGHQGSTAAVQNDRVSTIRRQRGHLHEHGSTVRDSLGNGPTRFPQRRYG